MDQKLPHLPAPEEFLFTVVEKLNQRLSVVNPAPGEGVVEEGLMKEGQALPVPDQDMFGGQDVGIVEQVIGIENRSGTDSRCRTLIASARTPITLAKRVGRRCWQSRRLRSQ